MVEIKIDATTAIEFAPQTDSKGVLLVIKTMFGTFRKSISTDTSSAIIFAIEKVHEELDAIQAREAATAHNG